MKELEKTKRISISAVLFLLVILVGLLTFRKPQYNFTNSAVTTLEEISRHNHIISLDQFKQLDPEGIKLIDVRNNVDFSKGHLENATNIPLNQLLSNEGTDGLRGPKTIVLYGANPEEANAAWMLLYQMGHNPMNVLAIRTFYENKKFQLEEVEVAKPQFDYVQKMEQVTSAEQQGSTLQKASEPVKKTVTAKPKKKKNVPEGGC